MPRLGPPTLRDMKVSVQKKAACKGCGEEEMETAVTYRFFGAGDGSQEGPLVWFPGAAQSVAESRPACLPAGEETKQGPETREDRRRTGTLRWWET